MLGMQKKIVNRIISLILAVTMIIPSNSIVFAETKKAENQVRSAVTVQMDENTEEEKAEAVNLGEEDSQKKDLQKKDSQENNLQEEDSKINKVGNIEEMENAEEPEDTEEAKETKEVENKEEAEDTKEARDTKEAENAEEEGNISAQIDTHAISDSGTEDNPIEISSESDLLELVELAKSRQVTGYYSLANDITLTTDNWIGIGNSSNCCFAGVFEGNGYTITALKTSGTDNYAGLFAYNKGTIRNLTVSGNITGGRNYAGILCAWNEGTIEYCCSTGTINSDVTRGGLLGYNTDKGVVSESSSQAVVKGDGAAAGGLVGHSSGIIRYSHASGNVSGSNGVGGLVGSAQWGEVSDSYASGNVSGNSGYLGGLVGDMYYGNIRGCYARGSVNGGNGCGLVGRQESGGVKYSYYNSANTGNKKGFAETIARLKRQETYYGWDFAHIWEMGEDGYPYINLRGEAEEIKIEGSGEEEDPYIIENEMQLFALSSGVLPAMQKRYYKLGNDIELTAGNWSMIWEFNGVFDGAGHTISGLKSMGTDYANVGLFGTNKGTIKNLSVSGSITDGGNYAGILCGTNEGTIENCSTSGTMNSDITRGGLVGYNKDKGVVSQSSSRATVKGEGSQVGGLIGYHAGTVCYSYASGNVSGSSNVGGLVGYNSYGEVSDSYASGNVSGNNGNSGGLVGCLYHGKVRGCYARGTVNGGDGCGLVGYLDSGSIRYSYYNSVNTGNKRGFSETTAKLKKQETYYGWDFAHIWGMGEDGYPYINLCGEVDEIEINGNGEEEDPYIIENEMQLFALSTGKLPATQKRYYKLGNDIELTAGNWSMIWEFNGVFDGAGHTVSGLKSIGTDYANVGLFGTNKGMIKNLSVSGSITDGRNYAGILCGTNEGTIENCSTSGTINSNITIGGLVGYNTDKGLVSQSGSQATVKGEGNQVGGLIGYHTGAVRYSYASGSVSGSSNVGGLVGYNSYGEVGDSYASGNVSGNNGNSGGLVGYLYRGNVRGCYAKGSVNGGEGCGLVGYLDSGSIKYSYYNSANTGNKRGFAETITKLKRQETYYGWDFAHIWEMGENGYPCIDLRGEPDEIEINGNGEEEDPYLIENEMQLFALSTGKLPATQKKYYKLENDIELTAGNWSMIWEFNGVFDGSGYTISGLKSTGTDYDNIGLFGTNKGTIRNLNIIGGITDGRNYAGILCGVNEGTIEDCSTSGMINSNVTRGGLVGYNMDKGVVSQSRSQATVKGDGNTSGGLVGYNAGKVYYSHASGSVSGSSNIGGLVGYSSNGEVSDSYASGNISGSNGNSGGLIGYLYHGNVKECYARGRVNGGDGCGLVGYLNSGNVRHSYYNSINTGNKIGFGETITKLKKQATYYGWDFAHIWKMGGDGYPCISLQGKADDIEISGNGEEDDPYIIENEMQLFALSSGILPATQKKYYKLGNDIQLTADNWGMIWDFNGTFDGAGHTISGLKSVGTNYGYAGLFGKNTGTIKNLAVEGVISNSSNNYAAIICAYNAGTIENCSASGAVSATCCRGGIAGYNEGTVSLSKASVTISGDSDIAGVLVGSNAKEIEFSYAEGKVNGNNSIGGLAGENSGTIENAYAVVSVSGNSNIGGLVGCHSGTVKNCYSVGNVSTEYSSYGGLIGYRSGTVISSYYSKNKSGCEDTDKGIPLSNLQMKDEASFEDWDFTEVWGIYNSINGGFPFLQAMFSEYEEEDSDFWYSVKESKKGYAFVNQKMGIFYSASPDCQVEYKVEYIGSDGKSKVSTVPAEYDQSSQAFAGEFEVVEGMQQISSIKAQVTDGITKEIPFTSSFWYQMPLKVEGTMQVVFNDDIINSSSMALKVFQKGQCIYKTALDGEPTIMVHSLETGTDYRVVVYGEGIEYASLDDIHVTQGLTATADFSGAAKMASLGVEFYVDGMEISNKELKAVFYDKTVGKSRLLGSGKYLEFLSEGDTIGYSISMGNQLAKTYKVDSKVYTITLKEGENVAKVELQRFQSVDISGTVYEQDGVTAVPGVKVTAVQQLNGIHSTTVSGNSDSLGKIELSGKDTETTITLSKKGYLTTTFTVSADRLGKIERKMERAQGRLQFGVSYLQAAEEDAEDIEEKYNLLPDKITIHNDTKNRTVTDVQNQWPNVYVETRQVSAGDTLNIRLSKGGYAAASLKATVLENGNAKVTGALLQYGGMELTLEREDGIASAKSHLMVYGEDGKKYSYKRGITKPCSFTGMPAGSYTIVSADESVAIDSYYQLKDLKENKDLAGFYIAKSVQVQDGVIGAERISVPAIEEKEAYLDAEKSGISINNASAMVGDTIVVRAEVTFRTNAKKVSAKAELTLPTGTRYVENSLTIDGKESAITPKNNMLSIPIEGKNTVIRYRVKVLSTITVSSIEFNGTASYSIDGENYINSIGKAELNINELTLIVPPKTRTNTFVARGVAEKNASIRIYDGDVLVGSVTANKYGAYRIEVTLPEDEVNRIHYLKAVNQETKAESEQAQVVCGNTDIDVIGFKVIHNGKTYDVGDPTVEVGNLNLTMIPSAPFEFIAYFTDNESVALVQTEIELTNGNIQFVDMEYNDAMGYWHGEVTLDSNRIPTAFNIGYLPLQSVYDKSQADMTELVASKTEIAYEKHYNDADKEYVFILKHTIDDANSNVIYEMTSIKDNAEFEMSGEYELTNINGKEAYVDIYEIVGAYQDVDYSGLEAYFKQEDGTYVRFIRAYGIDSKLQKNGKSILKTSAINGKDDEKKENWFNKIFQKASEKGEEIIENKFLEELDLKEEKTRLSKLKKTLDTIRKQSDAAEKCRKDTDVERLAKMFQGYLRSIMENGGPKAKMKASIYITQLDAYALMSKAPDVIDYCKILSDQGIDLEMASYEDKMLYEKVVKKVDKEIKKQLDENFDAMKDVANSVIYPDFINLIKTILSDPDLLDAVKELEEEYRKAGGREGNSLLTTKEVSTAKTSVDPSGYVYETFEDNRIQGVTATLYYENDMGDMQIWDAEEYNQENPLITDNDGNYAWDVPEGLWQVVYAKEGYETVSSRKMVVPPPQLDVNIAMVSTEAAEVSKISNIGDKLKITFDKYLLVDTILKDSIQVKYKDKVVDTKVCINKNDIRDYNGNQVVKVLELQLEDGLFADGQTYQIVRNNGIKTYAGVSLMPNTVSYVAESEAAPVSITIPDGVKVYLDESEITSGDLLYQNDRIKVVAETVDGYRLTSLKINNTEVENGAYFTVGKSAIIINASYERMPEESYTISAVAGKGGMITPSGDTEVLRGMNQAFRIQANSGYEIENVKVDGKSVGAVSDYTFSKVMENHTIEALFQKSDAIKIESIVLSHSEGNLEVGKTMLLQADIMPQNAKDKQLKWSSSNPKVASVENGLVTAIGEGSAVITAESQDGSNVSASCKIEVTDNSKKKEYTIIASAGTGGKITPEGTITVTEGESKTFAIKADHGYTIQDVKVDGKSVGAVSSYTMTDVKENHTIAASFQKPDTVKVEKITLSQAEASLEVGKTLLLEATVTPDNAENKQLKWSSDNRQVALVDDGFIAAIGEGSATITAESQDGSSISASCKIEVTGKSQKKEYTVTASAGMGGKITPEGTQTVAEGESKTFVITADNGYAIQDVKVDGKSVGAVSSYTIMDIKENHTIAATFQKPAPGSKEKESQSITGTPSYSKTYGNTPFKLDVTLEKGNGTLSYTSSNLKVAEVSVSGEVKITGTGNAFITVTASETEDYKKCEYQVSINVAKAAQRISGTAKYSKPAGSKPFRLNARRTVGDGKLSYLSANRTVATVSSNGTVTIKKPGSAIITITAASTANYNACTFRINVSVTAPKKGTTLTDPKTKAAYKVIKQGRSVEYVKPKDKKVTKVSIPATVTISGVKYNVTAIAANAFSGCKKLKAVTIGKNVESIGAKAFASCTALGKLALPAKASKIGKQAFSGCKKLKDITIKSTKLTSKSIGAKAFQGIYAKATIKVPKAKKAAYQKLLKSKGISKKVKIK